MAQRAITEYYAKKTLAQYIQTNRYGYRIHTSDDWNKCKKNHGPNNHKRVIKPDQGFGKRGEYGVMGLKLTTEEITQRINNNINKEVTINGHRDTLRDFLVEPRCNHTQERFVCIQTQRYGYQIQWSDQGGIGIEDRFDCVNTQTIPYQEYKQSQGKRPSALNDIIDAIITCMNENDRVYAEFNPIAYDSVGRLHILDAVVKVDTCASIRHPERSDENIWVSERGKKLTTCEYTIYEADQKTGASLKCTIINPQGKYRLVLGGGGASVVVMDTFHRLGLLNQVGNYGELSGNPTEDECFLYYHHIINAMLMSKNSKPVLMIVGGIANFTDIMAGALGCIKALQTYRDRLITYQCSIIRRRNGINGKKAQSIIRTRCYDNTIPYYEEDTNENLASSLTNLLQYTL